MHETHASKPITYVILSTGWDYRDGAHHCEGRHSIGQQLILNGSRTWPADKTKT
jgi:hypothetical protein